LTTSEYALNPDFHKLYLQDDTNRYFIKYYDGSSYYYIYWSSYDAVLSNNSQSNISIPNMFSIVDAPAASQLTGSATATGTLTGSYTLFQATGGETLLTNSAAPFANVKVGDIVHNTTDDSHGIVVALGSTSTLYCALFGGTLNYFTSGDAYIINPQSRYYLVVDPPSLTSGHTITVPYIQKPTPVYSYYRRYNIQSGYESAITSYAAWLYKYRDRDPQFGDSFYRLWDSKVRELGKVSLQAFNRQSFHVNFNKRAGRSNTYR
jgi:hypothetical protein